MTKPQPPSWQDARERDADENEKKNFYAVEHSRETFLEGWDAGRSFELERSAKLVEALENYCALPLPLDEMPNMTIEMALKIFAERIGVARKALAAYGGQGEHG